MSISDITGLWCDDITFCQEECERMDCPRNQHNIRDRSIPHSFAIGIPSDCPKHPKEQEAVKPVKQIEQNEWVVCGNCRNHLISKWMFCPYCGRSVKWE